MPMASPKQLTVESLRLATDACNAAIDSLDNALHPLDGPDLKVLHKDFLSLLSLLYGSTTKLSLALKPASPAYATSREPIKDLITQISALSHCVRLFGGQHGITLVQEITSVTKDVFQAIQSLLQTFLAIETNDKGGGNIRRVGDDYLVRVGAVHDVIDSARASLSKDNAGAVQKKLSQNHDAMLDGLGELDEMITSKGGADDSLEGDDGWGELGVDTKSPMTDHERERSRKVYAILRLTITLHERIMRDVSVWSLVSCERHPHIVGHLDSLPSQSSALAIAFDDLISTTYTPQDPSDLSSELSLLVVVIGNLRSNILPFLHDPDVIESMETAGIHAGFQGSNNSTKDTYRWFETCFNQIEKAAEALQSLLNLDR